MRLGYIAVAFLEGVTTDKCLRVLPNIREMVGQKSLPDF